MLSTKNWCDSLKMQAQSDVFSPVLMANTPSKLLIRVGPDLSFSNSFVMELSSHLHPVPSQAVVQSAISAFRRFLESEDGSEVGSLLLISRSAGEGIGNITYQQGFQMMDTVPHLQNVVEEASADKDMWETFLSLDPVKNFLHSGSVEAKNFLSLNTGANSTAKTRSKLETPEFNSLCSDQESPSPSNCLKDSTQEKILEAGIWKQVVSFLSEVGKTIWLTIKILFLGKDYVINEVKQEQARQYERARQEGRSGSFDDMADKAQFQLEVALILAVVVMLAISLMRTYSGIGI